jgi:hypothetical protein
MWLVEAEPRPLCTAWPATPRAHVHTDDCPVCSKLRRAYGDKPHIIAYRSWDEPRPDENAETYLLRHIRLARQYLGGIPYHLNQ